MKNIIRSSVIWDMPTEEFKKLVSSSKTYTEILNYFKLVLKGGNNQTLKRRITEENIDDSHIKNLPINYYAMEKVRVPIEDLLTEKSKYQRRNVKMAIIRERLIDHTICSICGNKNQWENKELVLILDHINGISDDHRIENLRILCPNCNSQQSTFAGRNKRKTEKTIRKTEKTIRKTEKTIRKTEKETRKTKSIKSKKCVYCDKEKTINKSDRCYSCYNKQKRKVKDRPSKEELEKMIQTMSWRSIGKTYGVSDNSIRKWAKLLNIDLTKK